MFECENREVEKVLVKLQNRCSAEGAYFHPEMKIVEKGGNFRVVAPFPRKRKETLIKIPITCMGAVQDFNLRVEGEHLVIHNHARDLQKSQIECFELAIELYNLCDKIKSHKTISPWFALSEHPDLLDFLISAKNGATKIEELQKLRKTENWEVLLRQNFLGTRGFSLRNNAKEAGRQVLLALLDFVNHHSTAPGFRSPEQKTAIGSPPEKKRFITIANSQPEARTGFNECFVSYCLLDPLGSLLNYGFIDKTSKLFRSISMKIDLLPGLCLQIDGRAETRNRKKEPELTTGMKKLQDFIPAVISAGPDHIRINHLLLPSAEVPQALRFVLPVLIKNNSSGYNHKQIVEASIRAESEIIAQNQQFYTQLHERVISAQITTPNNACLTMLKELAGFQSARLKEIISRQKI